MEQDKNFPVQRDEQNLKSHCEAKKKAKFVNGDYCVQLLYIYIM